MQQTEKYKLNLIDPDDEFSPEPLNQNAKTVETQLQAREAAEIALDTKLSAAIGTGGNNARIAYGTYSGNGRHSVSPGFKPMVVLACASNNGPYYCVNVLIRDCQSAAGTGSLTAEVSWTETSVSFSCGESNSRGLYVVIGMST